MLVFSRTRTPFLWTMGTHPSRPPQEARSGKVSTAVPGRRGPPHVRPAPGGLPRLPDLTPQRQEGSDSSVEAGSGDSQNLETLLSPSASVFPQEKRPVNA